jgi:hypothetical protein
MRLFHFSDEGGIARFELRTVVAERVAGRAWLDGPLVWAIEEAREALYLFPRACPRIVIWATPSTTAADRQAWLGCGDQVTFVEADRARRHARGAVFRYLLPQETFEDIGDAGMWVSRQAVNPLAVERLTDLPGQLAARGVELRVVESLAPLAELWRTSLHASGARLANSATWRGHEGSDGL